MESRYLGNWGSSLFPDRNDGCKQQARSLQDLSITLNASPGGSGWGCWRVENFKSYSPFHGLTAEGQGFWKPGASAGAQGLESPDLTFILAPPAFSL